MFTGTQNVRTVALMFIVLIYLLFGAAVFNALEAKKEMEMREESRSRIADILYKNSTIQNETIFNALMTTIFEHRHVRRGTSKQWTFPGAFYFSTLVVTLIGYGHIVPKTKGGRIFCMVYTVAGVPLNLIMFQSVGERLNAIISFILSRLKRCLGFRRHKVSAFELITVEFGMSTMLVLGGSYVFTQQEGWEYVDSIYYSLVTFWTIGFGDFVPLASLQRSGQSLYSRWGYYTFTILYILFGLAIMASSVNLLVLRLAQFHSENGIGGISAFLGRNEGDMIAAAIAEHRASIHIQQRNQIYSNSHSIVEQKKVVESLSSLNSGSWWSTPSSSNSDFGKNSHDRTCCWSLSLLLCKRRRRRHWHSRRSPQSIKHLLYFNHLLENHKYSYERKARLAGDTNHVTNWNCQKQQQQQHRVSL